MGYIIMDSLSNFYDAINKGIDKENKTIPSIYLTAIAEAHGIENDMADAIAQDLGAIIDITDPTDSISIEDQKNKNLGHVNDIILIHKLRNPEKYGENQAKRALNLLCAAYDRIATYAVPKTGLRGLDFESQNIIEEDDVIQTARLSMYEVFRSKYKIESGYALSTVIDRRCCGDIIECNRTGKFKDYHGMTRQDQTITKYVKENPEDKSDYAKIAKETGISEAKVKQYMTMTNGEWIGNDSLDDIIDRTNGGNSGSDSDDTNVQSIKFTYYEAQYSDDDTEQSATNNMVFEDISNIVEKVRKYGLTDEEKFVFEHRAAMEEKFPEIADMMQKSQSKVRAIYDEAVGKIKTWLKYAHYDEIAVRRILAEA